MRLGAAASVAVAPLVIAACEGGGAPAHRQERSPGPPERSASSHAASPHAASPSTASAGQLTALNELSRGLTAQARSAILVIPDAAGAHHPEYLKARRAVAAGSAYWRVQAPTGSEILIGPPVSTLEAGGVMSLLDAALTDADAQLVARYRTEAERALLHIDHEVGQSPLSTALAASVLSDASYDLGLRLLDGLPGSPDGPAPIAADLEGAFDGLSRGVEHLLDAAGPRAGADLRASLAQPLDVLRPRLTKLDPTKSLQGRALLVLKTGELGAAIRALGAALGAQPSLPYEPRVAARGGGIDEPVNALTLPAPRKSPRPVPPDEIEKLVALGERLFSDPRLSKGGLRSCATCHVPARAFADGAARPASLDPSAPPLRHTPTLLYSPLFASQLWDGRRITRESQALGVIHSPAEMGLGPGELVAALSGDERYKTAFAALPGGLSESNVARALGAFQVARLVPASAPIDRFARGDEGALTAEESAGLDVFSGPGRCARCHVPPSFGGVRPRDFSTSVYAVLGVPTAPGGDEIDPDPGRFGVTKLEIDRGSFKTPTARNVARTAPYFHNGAFTSLEQVVDFYDTGGVPRASERIENLDPDIRKLELTVAQKRALLAFLRSGLLDATPHRQ